MSRDKYTQYNQINQDDFEKKLQKQLTLLKNGVIFYLTD